MTKTGAIRQETPSASFHELEAVIERGLTTFVEVGNALMRIRDERLYRENHRTFDQYCRERWGWSRQRSHQLIGAARVSTIVDSPPANEAQARELARLPEDDVADARDELQDEHGDGLTAAVIREEVEKRTKPLNDPDAEADKTIRTAKTSARSLCRALDQVLDLANKHEAADVAGKLANADFLDTMHEVADRFDALMHLRRPPDGRTDAAPRLRSAPATGGDGS